MKAYRPRILNNWNGGLNTVESPAPVNCYRVGKNIRLTEHSIPERRPGTTKKNTNAACELAATDKPVLNACKYYPTGRTALWVAVADSGAASDIFTSTDGTNFTAQSLSLTASAVPYFAVFPTTEGASPTTEDGLYVVNGTDEIYYDPKGDAWGTWTANSFDTTVTGFTHICVHGDRIWPLKNNYAYYSEIAANTPANTFAFSTNYLDFAHQGENITCGISFNNDLVVFRPNSIGVLRGTDPLSGVQKTYIVNGSGTVSPQTLVIATYRGQPALYYLSLQGLSVFNGYVSKLIDDRVGIINLMNTTYLTTACAGLYDNRYLMLSFTRTGGTVNDTVVVYDTHRDIFIAKDEPTNTTTPANGYFPNCFWLLNGGTDKGEMYFGTSRDLGLIYRYGSGTTDGSPVTDGTNANIDTDFETVELFSGSATQQTRVRGMKAMLDTSPNSYITLAIKAEDGRIKESKTFGDTRTTTTHTWGESGLKWGQAGLKWGTGTAIHRNVFNWKLPQRLCAPYGYQMQASMEGQDKTFRLFQFEADERPRTNN